MKKIMLGTALGLFLFSACSPGGGDSYTIKGNLTNLKDSVLYLARQESGMPSFDTLKVTDGKFTYSGKTTKPVFAQIVTPDQRSGFPLFLEPGTIHITGNADSMSVGKIKVSGTPNNKDLDEFMEIQQPYMPTMMSIQQAYMKARMSGDTATLAHLENTMDSVRNVIMTKMKSFVKDHPESVVSALALQNMMEGMDDSTLNQLYSGLDTAIQHSTFGEQIGTRLAMEKKTSIGQQAPDFTMNDTTGTPVSLSSFRGKYVLVDFWASWCGPCREENPNVVKAYNEYKGKDFTILGVSLDKTKDAWEKAIKDDHLTWNHVSDLQYWDNAAAKLYGVQAIPANFLIDPSGKIIAKNLRGDKLDKELAQVLK
jgi:peroxiredoxin